MYSRVLLLFVVVHVPREVRLLVGAVHDVAADERRAARLSLHLFQQEGHADDESHHRSIRWQVEDVDCFAVERLLRELVTRLHDRRHELGRDHQRVLGLAL